MPNETGVLKKSYANKVISGRSIKTCKDCENFGGRAIFQYDGRSRVMCLDNLFKRIYPNDEICQFYEAHLPVYYRNDYLRRIITDILWRLGKRKIKV